MNADLAPGVAADRIAQQNGYPKATRFIFGSINCFLYAFDGEVVVMIAQSVNKT